MSIMNDETIKAFIGGMIIGGIIAVIIGLIIWGLFILGAWIIEVVKTGWNSEEADFLLGFNTPIVVSESVAWVG